MQEADYRTDEEKLKDEIFYHLMREMREAFAKKDLEEVKLILTRIKQLL